MNGERRSEESLPAGEPALTAGGRALHGLVASGAGLLIVVASLLHPDSRGHGTHEQLGLRPCTFLALTGVPCPSCGMTTAVSYVFHGQFRSAFAVQPAGALIGILVPFVGVALAWNAATGQRDLLATAERVRVRHVLWMLGFLGINWLYVLMVFE